MHLTLFGRPITKKNHTQRTKTGHQIQSVAYIQYEKDCLWQIPAKMRLSASGRFNMKALYYMTIDYENTKAVVDLAGLIQATCDILVKARVIADDNCRIIAGYDGSRVLYDKQNPRVEIELEEI
ncbi:RusA family crossover junction endodeoxyribonuclease [Candidatus Nomurabacteria bacterium]|nr:RusA family crossover junction endodeoxyribonuclease [Candidatus Nomurabacteria bacterium]